MSNLEQYLKRNAKLAGAGLATLFAPQNLDEEGNRLIQEEFAKLPSNVQGNIRNIPIGGLPQLGQTKLTPESIKQAKSFTEGTQKVETQKRFENKKKNIFNELPKQIEGNLQSIREERQIINSSQTLTPEEKADLLQGLDQEELEIKSIPDQIAEDNPYISPFQIKDLQNKIQKKSGIETLIPALEQPLQAFAGAGDFVNSAFATVEGVLNAPWGVGGEIEKFGRNEQARQLQQVSNRLNQNVSAEERNSLLKTKTYLEAQLAAPQKFATIGDAYTQGAQESFNFDKKIENEINKSTIAGTPIRQALDVDQGAGSQAARFLGSTALYALNPIKLPVPAGLAARTGGNLVLNLLKAGGAEAIEDALLNGLVSEGDVQKGILEGTIDPKDLNTERLKAFALNTVTDVMGGAALKGAGQLLGKGIKQVGEIPQQQIRANTAKAIRENLPEARFNQRFNAIAEATEKDIPELEQKINSLANTTPRKAELIESLNEKKLAIEEQKKLQADSEVVEVENKYKALTEIEQGTRITPRKEILETKKNQIDLDIKDPENFNSPEALEALNKKKEFVQSKLDEIQVKDNEKKLELTKRKEEIFQKKTDKEIANASKKEKAKISDNLRKSTDLGYVDSYKDAVYLTKNQELIDQFENRRYEIMTNSTNESIKKQKEGIKNHFSVINGINKTDKLEGYKTFIEDEDLTPVQKTMLTDHIDQRINDIEEKKAIRERLGEGQGQATTTQPKQQPTNVRENRIPPQTQPEVQTKTNEVPQTAVPEKVESPVVKIDEPIIQEAKSSQITGLKTIPLTKEQKIGVNELKNQYSEVLNKETAISEKPVRDGLESLGFEIRTNAKGDKYAQLGNQRISLKDIPPPYSLSGLKSSLKERIASQIAVKDIRAGKISDIEGIRSEFLDDAQASKYLDELDEKALYEEKQFIDSIRNATSQKDLDKIFNERPDLFTYDELANPSKYMKEYEAREAQLDSPTSKQSLPVETKPSKKKVIEVETEGKIEAIGERKLSKTVQEGGALNVLAKELADDFSKSPDAFYSVSKQNNFIEASNKIVEKMERNELFAKAQDLSAKALGDTRMNDAEIIELGAYVKHFALNDPDSPFTQNLLRGFRNQASESGKALVAFNNLILKNSDIDIEMKKQKRISEELGIDEKIQRKMIEKDNKFMSEIIDTDFDVFDC